MTGEVTLSVAVVRAGVCLSSSGQYSLLIAIPGHSPVAVEIPVSHVAAWALTAQVGIPINAQPIEEPER